MKRPDTPTMLEIESILQDLEEMEEAINQLKIRLEQLPAQIASELDTEAERIEAAKYLYWSIPRLSSKTIAKDLLGVSVRNIRNYIPSTEEFVPCERCQQSIYFTTRSHAHELKGRLRKDKKYYAEGYKIICDTCWQEILQRRGNHDQQRYSRFCQRLNELQKMPYQEYLKTPEWHSRRQKHLQSAGFRCQICNAKGVTLHVHHRTYERRGIERFTDLIVLCCKCHELFHQQGQLQTHHS
ncbi:hypothetical protein ACN4EK_30610 [Pantanalinema rosaneae CENA516]|uniref:HNH endonuclease n=1 Tax=Pantanalinema rosaneae TaxID=1620701 RepID=UPI003D6ED9B4